MRNHIVELARIYADVAQELTTAEEIIAQWLIVDHPDEAVSVAIVEMNRWLASAQEDVDEMSAKLALVEKILSDAEAIDFYMATPEGNVLLGTKLEELAIKCKSGLITRGFLEGAVSRVLREVELAGHPEAWSHAVRNVVYGVVDDMCDAKGWTRLYA